MPKSTKTKKSFEESLYELENIIDELEKDDLTLDRALGHFEKGIGLMRHCDSHLKSARGKLKELLKGENGDIVTKILGETLESFIDKENADG
ncbi:exodeoxyribonuclease VII small subunit [Chitinispirillum alkaliphilum]|nr:exodeoxyribonuclease VII small subunit [Chitinispirillum alkaliphilum]